MVFSEILEGVINWSMAFIQAYGPYSVFLVVILEEVLIPIPSPLVIMGAGFILIPANITFQQAAWQTFWIIVVPASIASTIGSFFTYFIGFYGGKPAVSKMHKFLGFGWAEVEKAEKRFKDKKSTWITITLLRAIPFFPIAIVSLTAGVLRLNKWKYATATFIGSIPRTFILGMLGWYFGSAYITLAKQLNVLEDFLVLGVVIVALYILYRFRHKYIKHANKLKNNVLDKAKISR